MSMSADTYVLFNVLIPRSLCPQAITLAPKCQEPPRSQIPTITLIKYKHIS